jgi:hypothetical protein
MPFSTLGWAAVICLCAAVLRPAPLRAETLVAVHPGIMCSSEVRIAEMERRNRPASRGTIQPQLANQVGLPEGCVRLPAGARVSLQFTRQTNVIVIYDAHDGKGPQAFVAPGANFRSEDQDHPGPPSQCFRQSAQVSLRGTVRQVDDDGSRTGTPFTSFVLHVPAPICVTSGAEEGKATNQINDVILALDEGQQSEIGQRVGLPLLVTGTISASEGAPAILYNPSFP